MRIEKLFAYRFRNLSHMEFYPSPGLNVIIGDNGQGKTSALEALYMLATMRSFRPGAMEDFIQSGSDQSALEAKLAHSELDKKTYRIVWKRQEEGLKFGRIASIDGKDFKRASLYLSQRFGPREQGFHAVVFNPGDHDLVAGEPSQRRDYLARVLGSEHFSWFDTFRRYERVLDQRNALLKTPFGVDFNLVSTFNAELVRLGSEIVLGRLRWLDQMVQGLPEVLEKLGQNSAEISVEYRSNFLKKTIYSKELDGVFLGGQGDLPSLEKIEASLKAILEGSGPLERIQRATLVGPHREDWQFLLRGRPLKLAGSQGEVRTALVGLKLWELESFRNRLGYSPVFLLDDFSSELDLGRRRALTKHLQDLGLQIFVTSTEADLSKLPKAQVFKMSSGNIEEYSK